MKWFWIAGIFSLLPIWRDSSYPNQGRNFWQFILDQSTAGHTLTHIPYEQAVTKAREAYHEVVQSISQ
jgi:hypothetical protein